MSPKISAKAIAAEIKKKNSAEANDIVEMMKRTAQKSKPSSEKASKTVIMERLFGSSSSFEMAKALKSDAVANPPKKPEKEVVLKQKARKDTVESAKTSSESIADDESGVVGMAIDLTGLSSSGIERGKSLPEMPNTRRSFARKADQIATSSSISVTDSVSKLTRLVVGNSCSVTV